jgi:hypothetical protein
MRVAVRRLDLEDTGVDRKDRHIKSAASEIKYKNAFLALLFIEAVGDCGSRGLVDDALNAEASDDTSVLSSLKKCEFIRKCPEKLSIESSAGE